MSGKDAESRRFWVCGVDVFEATGGRPDEARYGLGAFDTREEAEAFATAKAAVPHPSADPELCDEVEIHDRTSGRIIWSRQRPPG
jgi:hypothetical protein